MQKFLAGSIRVIRPLWKLVAAAAVALVLFMVIINGIKNPVEGPTNDFSASFTDVSGLRPNADVRMRGVKVGKVTSIDLDQGNGTDAVADVSFTLADGQTLTAKSRLAVKYANLSGVRYLDVVDTGDGAPATHHVPVANTVPSFDITELFNGLQPVLQTLSPAEINQFSNNALTLIQGDGSGLAPMLASVNTLSRYTADRQKVISTLVDNLSTVSDSLGGKSPQILEFIKNIEAPIDSALSVLDQFRTASLYGPELMGTVNSILAGVGIETTTDVDKTLSQAFPTIDNMWKSLQLLPTVLDGLQKPTAAPAAAAGCSKGELPLPAMGQVLLNGSGVVVCRG